MPANPKIVKVRNFINIKKKHRYDNGEFFSDLSSNLQCFQGNFFYKTNGKKQKTYIL